MSHYEVIPMQCPKCGNMNHFKNYNSINITVTPELKKAIMNDDIFKFECQDCHHVEYLRHQLFYHDTKNKIMLQYAKDPEEIEQTLAALKAEGLDLSSYKIRWTNNWYVFKEKIQIFDHHRDDRILAIYKENMLKKFYEEYPEAGHAVVFYHADLSEKPDDCQRAYESQILLFSRTVVCQYDGKSTYSEDAQIRYFNRCQRRLCKTCL
ncbi:CpXC domain-containing protein [uncultured Sharpea sp.]|uniref:CpXC domain-containing protein n=1 Tax=uncultured Sharpea sp. TaxID=1112738 RepID=UPI00258444EC|nr:CpXC domain-containing protein [uncultured Sharpea sp.]